MTTKWWNEFAKATLIRAIRTICQTAIATIGTAIVLTDVNWKYVVSASLLAGILSILTSLATGLPEVDLKVNQLQTNYNTDSLEDMVGDEDEEENDSADE